MKDWGRWVRKAEAEVRSWLGRHWGVLTLALVALVIVIGLTIWFWPTLKSNAEALRNLALVAAALFGLPLAFWRSWVAHKQASLQSEQTSLLRKQADTAERGHNNERYQKGADMLGSNVMTTRMGGVYALERVAQEHPLEYHVQIMQLLCAFLRHRAKDGGDEAEAESKELRLDLNAAAQAIGECRQRLAKRECLEDIERREPLVYNEGDFHPDLRAVNLFHATLFDANLSGREPLGREPCVRGPYGCEPLGRGPLERGPRGFEPLGREPLGRGHQARVPLSRGPFGREPLRRQPLGRGPWKRGHHRRQFL